MAVPQPAEAGQHDPPAPTSEGSVAPDRTEGGSHRQTKKTRTDQRSADRTDYRSA